ncbi:DUF3306 domain-containing protein [Bradyrhizobium erythrophlei]|uniref:DUF3306 domain-containing protein n=1 Tax=Bradyrhizobium erythrophlei TaxID=1437360 RepID=UPI0035EE7E0F
MSDEQFLTRWSRRKHEAKAGQAKPEEPVEPNGPAASAPAAAPPASTGVDLSSLPPIESIDAATDVAAFLRKGIPQELSRAALRRAWSADPAIRDFVGLAENAWDFNDPTAMPGFGPLDCSAEQIGALVRRVVGDVVQAAEDAADPLGGAAEDAVRSTAPEPERDQVSVSVQADSDPREVGEATPADLPLSSIAPQPPTEEPCVRRRTHGGALPR